MKQLITLMCLCLLMSNGYADNGCRDADGNVVEQAQCADDGNGAANASALPEEAMAEVNELNVKFRYFKAIGFHKQSKEKRDEIAAIYEKYGVPLPDEYKE